jgi:hypothetical protein
MILLIRLVPLLTGLAQAALFWSQRREPRLYPWLAALAVVLLFAASLVIGGRQVKFRDMLEKMAPTYLVVAVLGFALLLVEGQWPFWLLMALAAFSAFISLELLFLHARNPRAYPINGLSHVNIAYVPLAVWYATMTSSGLLVFLHSDGIWHVALSAALGLILFRTTGHPGATPQQNRVWMIVGALVGCEIGLLGLLLPVAMPVQGLIAVLLFCGALRVRRYLYEPRPSRRLAWSESLGLTVMLAATLLSAKWL